ncbi:MAG: pyridoxal-phosphate dependent enzyme [Candidatus Obscuribacterales bacterium]
MVVYKRNEVEPLIYGESIVSDIDDIVRDLLELRFLTDGLAEHSTDSLDAARKIRARVRKSFDLVERVARWGEPGTIAEVVSSVRQDYLEIKNALRVAYRQRGLSACLTDWQSPVYETTCSFSMDNRLTDGIAEHVLDYKRDGHLEAASYERRFESEYLSHLGSDTIKAYLTSCGMSAFSSVLHFLQGEYRVAGPAMALEPMYFENIHLARAFFPDLEIFRTTGKDSLRARLEEVMPRIIFVDAVSNCGEVMVHDLETIMDFAATGTVDETFVVIDSTCLPAPLLPGGMLSDLPDHLHVILVESLAKHHQFGMDGVTGGIVAWHAPERIQSGFFKTRARFGANIADSSVGSLPCPDRKNLENRMRRHARNMERLVTGLELAGGTSVIESISWAGNGAGDCAWFRSPVASIRFRKEFARVDLYKQFEDTVLELARTCDFPLGFSTSFGFDITRLYVTAPATVWEPPFLRISIGTETASQVDELVALLIEADRRIFARQPASPRAQTVDAVNRTEAKRASFGRRSGTFTGETALADYLDPANYAPAPLVELPAKLNPYASRGIRILAKMMPLVPLMNVKSIPAYSMLKAASERGELQDVARIIESSSSNTVMSLSVMARLFGVDSTCALVDHDIAPALLRMLQLFGIEPFLHPGPGHEQFGKLEPRAYRARNMGAQPGWLNPGQYGNPDNPAGFARYLAPDLWAQTGGRLGILSLALGTCGTMVGVAGELRSRNPHLQVVACCPARGQAVPGPREKALLGDVTFDWQNIPNHSQEVEGRESFATSVELVRNGIMGGPSSGMNLAGLLSYLQYLDGEGRLEPMASRAGELVCAFLCCDSPLQHVDEYFEALGEDYFPAVHEVPSQPAP